MIQFNLLPDVKIAFIKARRVKRLVIFASLAVSGAVLCGTILLFTLVNVVGKGHLTDLDKDVQKEVNNLKSIADIDKILTIQNQLVSLPTLHNQKPVVSRVFGYISSFTPTQATIAKFSIDFDQKTIEITGGADKIETINKFVDTLKFMTYKTSDEATETPKAFSNVVLASFGRDEKGANYKINFSFDPAIFDSAYPKIQLIVPKIITTRSQTEQPGALLDASKAPAETTGGTQ